MVEFLSVDFVHLNPAISPKVRGVSPCYAYETAVHVLCFPMFVYCFFGVGTWASVKRTVHFHAGRSFDAAETHRAFDMVLVIYGYGQSKAVFRARPCMCTWCDSRVCAFA